MSTLPGKYDLHFWKGATFDQRFTLYSDVGAQVPRNLTGWTAVLRIKDSKDGILEELTVGNGITITPTSGIVDIQMTEDETRVYWKQARYEFLIESPSGDRTEALLYGRITAQGL